MRVAFLWTEMSGYTNACLKSLAAVEGVELLVVRMRGGAEAPFADAEFAWLRNHCRFDGEPPTPEVWRLVRSFAPDLLIFCSWNRPAYRYVARRLAGRIPRIMAMDNQWHGSLRQYLGRLTRYFYIRPIADFAFVPGSRQATFARHLGFADDRIIHGLNAADVAAFTPPAGVGRQDRFIYVGRLSAEKGIGQLLKAYDLYRAAAGSLPGEAAWPLRLCGTGPLAEECRGRPGIECTGFIQPERLPEQLWHSACAIQPSLFEPWAVSIHEATVAGLPIICTSACGAADHLVQDGHNGFLVQPGDPAGLANAMLRFTRLSPSRRAAMGSASLELSRQFSPERWAAAVFDARTRFEEIGPRS